MPNLSGRDLCPLTTAAKGVQVTNPLFNPGRRMFEQGRKLRRAKRLMQLRSVTAVPTKPATVLQFPDKKEVTDGTNQNG